MLKLYSNGITLYLPKNSHSGGGLRSNTTGWSEASTRSNTQFLYSVDTESLSGYGYAFTFTIRDLPPTPKHWKSLRDAFIKRCNRLGLIRYHWVTEWQRRGVPHLHGCLYFPTPLHVNEIRKLKKFWVEVATQYVASYQAQDIKPIDSAVGWVQYLSKHGSRSKHHYQRSEKPTQWASSGRVWGKGGEWITRETYADLTTKEFHRLRRLARSWRIADARQPQPVKLGTFTLYPDNPMYWNMLPNGHRATKRIRSARRCLTCPDPLKSSVRGVSEWISEGVALDMLTFIKSNPIKETKQ